MLCYPEYKERYCEILLLLMKNIPVDVCKYILFLQQSIIEKEVETITMFPELIKFYTKLNSDDKINLVIFDSDIRKIIHQFCEQHELISKSEYKKTESIIARKCTYCDRWTNNHIDNRGDAIFRCDRCGDDSDDYVNDVVGCESCDDINDLIADKEIKFAYKCNGNMLIMRKSNIIPGYKKSGNYRKRSKK